MTRDEANIYSADHELAALLRAAAHAGSRLRLRAGGDVYEVHVTTAAPIRDLWANYDPERVRATIQRSMALGSSAEPAELDAVIAEIRAQRDQAPRQIRT